MMMLSRAIKAIGMFLDFAQFGNNVTLSSGRSNDLGPLHYLPKCGVILSSCRLIFNDAFDSLGRGMNFSEVHKGLTRRSSAAASGRARDCGLKGSNHLKTK